MLAAVPSPELPGAQADAIAEAAPLPAVAVMDEVAVPVVADEAWII